MSGREPPMADPVAEPAAVPEDAQAERDREERRLLAQPEPAADLLPEDVRAERDREVRVGSEEVRQRLAEGRPPLEDEPRS